MSIIKKNKNFKENIIKLLYNFIDKLLYYKRENKVLRLYIFFILK